MTGAAELRLVERQQRRRRTLAAAAEEHGSFLVFNSILSYFHFIFLLFFFYSRPQTNQWFEFQLARPFRLFLPPNTLSAAQIFVRMASRTKYLSADKLFVRGLYIALGR